MVDSSLTVEETIWVSCRCTIWHVHTGAVKVHR